MKTEQFVNSAGLGRPKAFVVSPLGAEFQTYGFSGNIGGRVFARMVGAPGFWKVKGSEQ